jgi:flagellar basal body-associated protein FliL
MEENQNNLSNKGIQESAAQVQSDADEQALLDQIIAEEDPEFAGQLEQIAQDPDLKNAILTPQEGLQEYLSLMQSKKGLVGRMAHRLPFIFIISFYLPKFLWFLSAPTFEFIVQFLKEKLDQLRAIEWKKIFIILKNKLSFTPPKIHWKEKTKKQKIAFVGLGITFGLLIGYMYFVYHYGIFGERHRTYLLSWKEVADEVQDFNEADQVAFLDHYQMEQSIYWFQKVVANIKPSVSSKNNPMGAFDFYFFAFDDESLVMVKNIEPEIRDNIARIMETKTFDDLNSRNGRKVLCSEIKEMINTLIKHEGVQKVIVKNFVVKP